MVQVSCFIVSDCRHSLARRAYLTIVGVQCRVRRIPSVSKSGTPRPEASEQGLELNGGYAYNNGDFGLFGPRIFFSTNWTDKHKLNPFGEVQIGGSHLNQKVTQVNKPTVSESDTEFSWLLGAGVDYLFASHWSARANLGLLTTQFANEGQSHFHLVLGIAYTFGSRKK
jgi:hypothetical protein